MLVMMLVWEARAPRRPRTVRRLSRWPGNLAVAGLDTVLVRWAFPASAVGAAVAAEAGGWGVLAGLHLPSWVAFVVSVTLLDLSVYLQHVAFHRVPVLWRVHRMHHADLDLDVTSGARFHPLESVLSMAAKVGVVMALGAPPAAVLVFEVLLNATAMFNHSNVALPRLLDQLCRCVVVTPDMHRVHHSIRPEETNSNYGFNMPWWDWLFRTYRDEPMAGQLGMHIGLDQFRDPRELRVHRMLLQPFLMLLLVVGPAMTSDETGPQVAKPRECCRRVVSHPG